MPTPTLTVEERPKARKGSSGHEERIFKIIADPTATLEDKNSLTSQEIIAALLASPTLVPPSIASAAGIAMARADSEIFVDEMGPGLWYGQVQWKLLDTATQPPESFSVSFDISTQSVHITHSRKTVNRFPWAGNQKYAIDFNNAINVEEDGAINGTDIIVPALSFELNVTKGSTFVTNAYIQSLMRIVGRVNTDTYRDFQPGTLLLNKVTGIRRPEARDENGYVWDLQTGFAASENETDLQVGGITGIQKKGWEFMWVHFRSKQTTVDSVNYTTKYPVCVYVEEVYKKAAYSGLRI